MHNNFKGEVKEQVSFYFILLFAMNGGKWGDSWQYQMGVKGMKLKHPRKPSEPHPLLSDWIFDIPPANDNGRAYKVTEYFGKKSIAEHFWTDTLENEDEDKLLIVLRERFDMPQLELQELWERVDFTIRKVKSFKFLHGHRSFNNSWTNKEAKAFIKLNNEKILKFDTVVEFNIGDDVAVVCYGQVWDIWEGPLTHNWVDTEYHSYQK